MFCAITFEKSNKNKKANLFRDDDNFPSPSFFPSQTRHHSGVWKREEEGEGGREGNAKNFKVDLKVKSRRDEWIFSFRVACVCLFVTLCQFEAERVQVSQKRDFTCRHTKKKHKMVAKLIFLNFFFLQIYFATQK